MKRITVWLVAVSTAVLCLLTLTQLGHFVDAGEASPPAHADLLIVLGGDDGSRVIRGAQLFQSGIAPRILLTGIEFAPVESQRYYLNWRAVLLFDAGVAKNALLFDAVSANSRDEAVNTLNLMRRNGWRSVVVVTDPPHMRRLNWVWGKVFANSGLSYALVSSRPTWWHADDWWTNEKSAQFVLS